MTTEQVSALFNKLHEIIGEQVNGFVFIASVEDSEGEERIISQYVGGRSNALGMVHVMDARLKAQIAREEHEEV